MLLTGPLKRQCFIYADRLSKRSWDSACQTFLHIIMRKSPFLLQIHQHSAMEGKIISSVTPPNCSLFQEAAMGNRGRERLTLGCNRMEKDDRSSHSHFDTLYIAWPWFQRHIVHRDQFAHTVDIRWDHRRAGMTIDILTHDPFSHEKGFIH